MEGQRRVRRRLAPDADPRRRRRSPRREGDLRQHVQLDQLKRVVHDLFVARASEARGGQKEKRGRGRKGGAGERAAKRLSDRLRDDKRMREAGRNGGRRGRGHLETRSCGRVGFIARGGTHESTPPALSQTKLIRSKLLNYLLPGRLPAGDEVDVARVELIGYRSNVPVEESPRSLHSFRRYGWGSQVFREREAVVDASRRPRAEMVVGEA